MPNLPNLPNVKVTPCCPKCTQALVWQPAAVHWHCPRCRLSYSAQQILKGENK